MYAKHLCEKAGVKFILGSPHGRFKSLIKDDTDQRIIGIETLDGVKHDADLVIVAGECPFSFKISLTLVAGGWSASIVPEAHQAIETTAGTVLFVDIPEDRQDLRQQFHPDNWPVWSVRNGSGEE